MKWQCHVLILRYVWVSRTFWSYLMKGVKFRWGIDYIRIYSYVTEPHWWLVHQILNQAVWALVWCHCSTFLTTYKQHEHNNKDHCCVTSCCCSHWWPEINLRTFGLIVSPHPYCAPKMPSTKMNNDRANGHCYSFAWI